MINITNKIDCCGCNACGDVCTYNAISFEKDIEGFWYPIIDKTKCVNCGLCDSVCPIINVKKLKKNDLEQSICYAAEHKNIEVVFDSTSGGVFSALADVIYMNKGYVGGAVFDENFLVKHYISNDKKDLIKLRSSKYLQSNLEGFYKEVRGLLKIGEKVLVCGTPCQMAALRAFLRKDYENLIIADFICLGVNSPKVWRKYLDSFEERYAHKVIYCKAKSKEYGWRNLTQKVILDNGKEYYETGDQSDFTKGYLRTHVYARPSCYECKFKGYPRIADITLADFWKIEKIDKTLDKDLGTSLVMINSEKGKDFFEKIKSRINYHKVPFCLIEMGNMALKESMPPALVDRKQFFDDLDKMTFLQIAQKYISESDNKGVKTRIKPLLKNIRGMFKLFCDTRFSLISLYKLLYNNSLLEILHGHFIFPTPHSVIRIRRGAIVEKKGRMVLGWKKFPKSHLESRLLVDKGAKIVIGGNVNIGYGADIEVFPGGELIFKGGTGTNISTTIICSEKIIIGRDVQIGRNVTIRDNNGGHYINRQGYKNSRPVVIGDKVWLCEGCVIMPGVKIGDGAIVGAHAFVTSNVPAHALVSGNPAVVVDEDILWKY